MSKETAILLIGASGRMGQQVIMAAARASEAGMPTRVVGGLVGPDDPAHGDRVAGIPEALTSEWVDAYSEANVIVDFSSAAGARQAIAISKAQKIPALVCSTGLGAEFDTEFESLSKIVPFIYASNTSVGVNVMFQLVKEATALLGDSYDIEVSDIHHKMKKDSPSGTAITLLERIAEARGVSLEDVVNYGRDKQSAERKKGEIGVSAFRGGDVAGEHTVYYFGDGERVEITHRATDRKIFADGAIKAANWLAAIGKPGRYSMIDVLS